MPFTQKEANKLIKTYMGNFFGELTIQLYSERNVPIETQIEILGEALKNETEEERRIPSYYDYTINYTRSLQQS